MAMSRPLRLVQQGAQPFSCPLCNSIHASYIFGTGQIRIYCCSGCALTFSHKAGREAKESTANETAIVAPIIRTERDHAGLSAAIKVAGINDPILLVACPEDGLIELLRDRGLTIGTLVGDSESGANDSGQICQAAIVSDALMRVADPRATLAKVRRHLVSGAPLVLSMPLLDGRQARLMGRSWHEWHPANRWYFTRETLSLLLLSVGFEHVWFDVERRRYSFEQVSERMR